MTIGPSHGAPGTGLKALGALRVWDASFLSPTSAMTTHGPSQEARQ
jgi:hypothetical protein